MPAQTNQSHTVPPAPWGIIADDLTGACDTGVQFSERGFRALVVRDQAAESFHDCDVVAVSTASRDDSPEVAREKVRRACFWMQSRGIRVLYKKIDSVLRGNIGPEVEAAMETCNFGHAVLTPAFPAMGRVVAGGRLEVCTSDSFVPVDITGLLSTTKSVAVKDARTSGELSTIAAAALDTEPPPLLAGSAGLASQVAVILASRLNRLSRLPRLDRVDKPILFLIGSTHPTTLRQLDELRTRASFEFFEADSLDRSVCEQAGAERRHAVAAIDLGKLPADFSEKLRDLANPDCIGALVVSGGDTAGVVCDALEIEAIELIAELMPGIPSGRLRGSSAAGLPIVTKSGGFGKPDSLKKIAENLSSWRNISAA